LYTAASDSEEIVAVVHDRGRRVRFVGEPAEKLARLCEDLVRRSEGSVGGTGTDYVRGLRAEEVVVEVRFPESKEIPLTWRETPTRPQYLAVPLTGPDVFSSDGAVIYIGQHAELDPNEPVYQLLGDPNPRDEFHIRYIATVYTPHALGPLREAVTQLGFDAPLQTPRTPPTPEPPMPWPTN
jgi:hypothetical protein